MSIVDVLILNFVEKNVVRVTGAVAITLVDGGVHINGTLRSTVRDQKKNKDVLNVNIPVDARVTTHDIVIPLPAIP